MTAVKRSVQAAVGLGVLLAGFALAMAGARLAMGQLGPGHAALDLDPGSALTADYSSGADGPRLRPLDPAIIDGTARDERLGGHESAPEDDGRATDPETPPSPAEEPTAKNPTTPSRELPYADPRGGDGTAAPTTPTPPVQHRAQRPASDVEEAPRTPTPEQTPTHPGRSTPTPATRTPDSTAVPPPPPADEDPVSPLPTLAVPTIEPPPIEAPTLAVPTIELPPIDVPTVDVPPIDPSPVLPTVDIPPIDLPPIEAPTVEVPPIEVPTVDLGGIL